MDSINPLHKYKKIFRKGDEPEGESKDDQESGKWNWLLKVVVVVKEEKDATAQDKPSAAQSQALDHSKYILRNSWVCEGAYVYLQRL